MFTFVISFINNVNKHSYIGSLTTKEGGAVTDAKTRIRKANVAFIQLYPVWKLIEISVATKIRTFRTHVKAALLYGTKTWKITWKLLSVCKFS